MILNHLPIVGLPLAGIVLGYGTLKKASVVIRLGLSLIVLLSIATIPVYLSGEPAEDKIEEQANVSKHFIEEHEEAAETAFVVVLVTGSLALLALLAGKKSLGVEARLIKATALGVLASVALLVWTGSLGGKISHPELRSAQEGKLQASDAD